MATARDELQEVDSLQPGYLRFPEEARVTPTTSADDLARLGKQAGLIGLGFAPGAGMADYLGYFPSAEGGTEPSAMQNIQQGNYGTAAMQGLGAMGDLMYAVPFLGATVGSALKGPRTAQKMLRELGFKEDIPNEDWLAGKIEDAVEGGRNQFGVPKRMGSVTGYFDKPQEVPVEVLAKLPGERGEQANVRPESLDYIRENWDEVSKQPAYIEVDPFGKAWVSEGNHRIMVAKELGVETLPVEIRYFSGGQRNAREFSPENILRMQEQKQPPPAPPLESKEFKNWFGDSKAVMLVNRETGLPATSSSEPIKRVPQPMYHTTRNDFEGFQVGRPTANMGTFGEEIRTTRAAIFVTPDSNASQAYGTLGGEFAKGANVMPVYIKAENPLDLTDGVPEEAAEKLIQAGVNPLYIKNQLGKWQMFDGDNGEVLVEAIKDAGYDSVIFNDVNPDTGDFFEAYAVFEPTQIKSAFNRGTYDPEDPRILYGAGAAGTAGIMSLSGEDAEAAQ